MEHSETCCPILPATCDRYYCNNNVYSYSNVDIVFIISKVIFTTSFFLNINKYASHQFNSDLTNGDLATVFSTGGTFQGFTALIGR